MSPPQSENQLDVGLLGPMFCGSGIRSHQNTANFLIEFEQSRYTRAQCRNWICL